MGEAGSNQRPLFVRQALIPSELLAREAGEEWAKLESNQRASSLSEKRSAS